MRLLHAEEGDMHECYGTDREVSLNTHVVSTIKCITSIEVIQLSCKPNARYHSKFCVMAQSRKVRRPGLDGV